MPFFQEPPSLGNLYASDRALRSYLARALPESVLRAVEPELMEMGELSGGFLEELDRRWRHAEPKLVPWDAWGNRVDAIEVTPVWEAAARLAAERGLVATAYERKHGEHSRIHQLALAYLFDGATEVYSCPLAMTDGAAKALVVHRNPELLDRALPRLLSRDPARVWTSGQWMTERTGGSDVATSETMARREGNGWRLYGTKWFTSATTAQMALTLARPEGNPPGGKGLALFYLETRDAQGRLRGIQVNRLKEKMGTRMVPTAELTLEGVSAVPVVGLTDGVKHITPMLNITRVWNSVVACSSMRRGLALARDYASKRVAFGAPLVRKPLHVDTLAGLEAELEGALHVTFRCVELLGREEAGTIGQEEALLLRLLIPIVKATTGKQAVAVASEVLESFGGAGYVEDTGLPRIVRDAHVLPVWEGTTNVLSLDVLRALVKVGGLGPIEREVSWRVEGLQDPSMGAAGAVATRAVAHARTWLERNAARGPETLEAGARRFALTLGRALELALLVDHAEWSASRGDARPAAAARRFAIGPVDLIADDAGLQDARLLLDA